MKILHIGRIKNFCFTGTSVVIPEHVKYQGEYAEVCFVNINDEKIDGIATQLDYGGDIRNALEKTGKTDLVVFHEVYIKEYLKISAYLRKQKIPYIIVPHGCLAKNAQKIKWLKKKIANVVFSPFLRGAAAFQCLSESEVKNFVLKRYKRFIGANGTLVAATSKKNFNTDKTNLIYVGRLTPYIKGIDLLLGAIDKEREFFAENNCRLDIYGPNVFGWEQPILAEIEEKGLSELVTLHDKVAGAEKEKILLGADVFVQTSRSEGLPLGVLEALGYGLPVLITEGTNMTEIVSRYNAGFTCETSVDSIADALKKAVLERNNYSSISSSAINLIKENFDWEIIAKKATEDYRKIINNTFFGWSK